MSRLPSSADPLMVAGNSYAFHSVQFHPTEPRLLIAANQKTGIGLWDLRYIGPPHHTDNSCYLFLQYLPVPVNS